MADDKAPGLAAVGEFFAGVSKLNADSLRRYFEIQGSGMQAFAAANRELLESLRDAKSMADAAAAQRKYFEAMQQNAQLSMAQQLELARQVGEETQALLGNIGKRS